MQLVITNGYPEKTPGAFKPTLISFLQRNGEDDF
jgi:hypothetical protein